MSTHKQKKMFTSAIAVFGTGAAIVFASALYYSISTGNSFATAILSVASVIAGISVLVLFKKETGS